MCLNSVPVFLEKNITRLTIVSVFRNCSESFKNFVAILVGPLKFQSGCHGVLNHLKYVYKMFVNFKNDRVLKQCSSIPKMFANTKKYSWIQKMFMNFPK